MCSSAGCCDHLLQADLNQPPHKAQIAGDAAAAARQAKRACKVLKKTSYALDGAAGGATRYDLRWFSDLVAAAVASVDAK